MNHTEKVIGGASLAESIAGKLEEMILSDSMQIEKKLPSEQSLAISFGVSRPVIREALLLLRGRGLIEPKNGEGSFVRKPTADTLTQTLNRIAQLEQMDHRDLFAVRLNLELMAVRLAAENITAEGIVALRAVHEEFTAEVSDERRAQLDIAFHEKIAEAGGNPLLSMMVHSLAALLVTMITETLTLPGSKESGEREHEQLMRLLESGDADGAVELMRVHLLRSIRNYEEHLRRNGMEK